MVDIPDIPQDTTAYQVYLGIPKKSPLPPGCEVGDGEKSEAVHSFLNPLCFICGSGWDKPNHESSLP